MKPYVSDQTTVTISFLPSSLRSRLFVGLFTSLLWICAAGNTHTELKALSSRIDRITKELDTLHDNETAIEKSLAKTERSIGKSVRALKELEQQIQQVRQRRQSLQKALIKHRKKLDQQTVLLARQLRLAYALGRTAPLQLIMNLDDPTTVSRTLSYHRYLNQALVSQIRETQRQLEEIHSLTLRLEQSEQRLTGLLKQQQQELKHLKSLRSDRKRTLAQIKQQVADKRSQLARMEQDRRRLTKLVKSVSRASEELSFSNVGHRPFKTLKGRFHWPVAGQLRIRFGTPRGVGRWEGVVISAPEGTPVKAIHPGKVIFSDWLRGYGLLIILRHDHDFMTLYAFNQSLLKQVGDRVKAGEVIATVGRSGGRKHTGVYFAIRHRGEPVNPLRWCRRPRKNRVN